MFDGFECSHRRPNCFTGDVREPRRTHRREHIFYIVRTHQRDFCNRHYRLRRRALSRAKEDRFTVHKRTLFYLPPAEPEDLRPGLGRNPLCRFVVGIQHQKIFLCLVLRDARFGRGIVFKTPMAIEMIRCDVQHQRHPRPKLFDRFQLKAGNFQHIPGFRGRCRYHRHHRHADIAAHQGRLAARGKDFAQQRRCGRLSIRSRDRDDLTLQKLRTQLELADDAQPQRAYLFQLRHIERDARRNDNQILPPKSQQPVAAGFDDDAFVEQLRQLSHRGRRPRVTDCYPCAACLQETRRRQAALPQADHQHAFVLQRHHLCSRTQFKQFVTIAASMSSGQITQKRVP